MRKRFFWFLFVGVTFPLALAVVPVACATSGGGNGASGEGGGDEGSSFEGGEGAVGDGGSREGGEGGAIDASATQACIDNANQYCMQLSTCSPFLLSIEYGDEITCVQEVQPGCLDALAAKGTGWTGANLEACITARSMLSCFDFLYAKPYPKVCTPVGKLGNTACRYDAQCNSGYCHIPTGTMCGTCVTRNQTGATCQSDDDCDGNLRCAGMPGMTVCAVPSGIGGPCSTTTPCNNGLACLGSMCAVPGGVDGGCGDAGGTCDYNLGAYCPSGGNACSPVTVDNPGASCMGPPTDQCPGSGSCQQGFCLAPVADMGSCEGGLTCTPPDTCNSGTCSLFSASQCK